MSDLITRLMAHEGFSSHVYKCPAGHDTIGFGRNVELHSGPGITLAEGEYLLKNDVMRCQRELAGSGLIRENHHPEDVMSVLVELCFWIGLPRLRGFKLMIAAINADDYDRAADELMDSKLGREYSKRASTLAGILRNA